MIFIYVLVAYVYSAPAGRISGMIEWLVPRSTDCQLVRKAMKKLNILPIEDNVANDCCAQNTGVSCVGNRVVSLRLVYNFLSNNDAVKFPKSLFQLDKLEVLY
jgi:hypothetical protein